MRSAATTKRRVSCGARSSRSCSRRSKTRTTLRDRRRRRLGGIFGVDPAAGLGQRTGLELPAQFAHLRGIGAGGRYDLRLIEALLELRGRRAEIEGRVIQDEVLNHRYVLASSATPRPKPAPTPPGLPLTS